MAKFKKGKNSAEPTEGIVVGDTTSKPKKVKTKMIRSLPQSGVGEATGLRKNRPLLLVFICVLVLVTIFFLFRGLTNKKVTPEAVLEEFNANPTLLDPNKISDVETAINEAEKSGNKEQLVQLYLRLASLGISNNQPKKAIEGFEKRNQLDPSTSEVDAYSLAQAYEQDGQKAKAIEKYEVALNYYQDHTNFPSSEFESTGGNDYYIDVINRKLEELRK